MTEERHRGWLIEENWLGWWEGTHPNYDGPEDNRSFVDPTRQGLFDEIDNWFVENGE